MAGDFQQLATQNRRTGSLETKRIREKPGFGASFRSCLGAWQNVRMPGWGGRIRTSKWRIQIGRSRLREKNSKWFARNPLLHQVNQRPDFVLRYEGFGEKSILQALSRASGVVRQILRDENPVKIRGIFPVFPTFGTANLFMVAERVGFEPTVRFPAHTLSKRAP